MPADQVRDNTAAHRFELEREGHVAWTEYALDGGVITLTHTRVPHELEGHGIGSALAAAALASARTRGLKVVPVCSFIAAYMQRHPETQDLRADTAMASAQIPPKETISP